MRRASPSALRGASLAARATARTAGPRCRPAASARGRAGIARSLAGAPAAPRGRRGGVIDQHDLHLRAALREGASDGALQRRRAVMGRDDDAEQRVDKWRASQLRAHMY
jgi:hypothetical protein